MKAPRCGAKNRQGSPCQCTAMRGKRRCRLHGGKSTGARTKAGIQRIRAASWKDGSRSARLQAEAKVQAAAEEREIFAQMTKDYDATTIYVRRLLGKPDFPKVKVRIIWRCPGGPPREWDEITDPMKAPDPMDDFEKLEIFGGSKTVCRAIKID